MSGFEQSSVFNGIVSTAALTASGTTVGQWLNADLTLTGTYTGTGANENLARVTDSVVNDSATAVLYGWVFAQKMEAPASGQRTAIIGSCVYDSGATTTSDMSAQSWVAAGVQGLGVFNYGPSLTPGTYRGSVWGGVFQATVNPTNPQNPGSPGGYFALAIGTELDVQVTSATNGVNVKAGLLITKIGTGLASTADAVQGTVTDAAINIADKTGSHQAVPWVNGLLFGQTGQRWPFSNGTDPLSTFSTLIGTQNVGSLQANKGVDFTGVTFAASAFASAGFSVDPSGNVVGASFARSTGGASWPVLGQAQYSPGTTTTYAQTGTTFAALDTTNLTVAFTVPPSGQVLVELEAEAVAVAGTVYWGLQDHTSHAAVGSSGYVAATTAVRAVFRQLITGLTPGASLQYDWSQANGTGGDVAHTFASGQTTATQAGPASMRVLAA